jgi:nuclear transport factor 2 (NTF2) superfamily protein
MTTGRISIRRSLTRSWRKSKDKKGLKPKYAATGNKTTH